jgi:toxin ParE1/3/4
MAWRIEFSADAECDIDILFRHLADSYVAFGEPRMVAASRAVERIGRILDRTERIARAPYRGERHDDLLPDLRHLTLDRAIYWYRIDDTRQVVSILAIFYGGQDHVRQMLLRLLNQ